MTKRIFRSILAVVIIMLFFCILMGGSVIYQSLNNLQHEQLHAELDLAAEGYYHGGMAYLNSLSPNTYRLTLINAQGKVLFDTDATIDHLKNHNNRPEIIATQTQGMGESRRYSETLHKEVTYLAERLPNGDILRLGLFAESVGQRLLASLPMLLGLILLSVFFSSILASRLSKRIVKPLNQFNLDEPMANEAYEELQPMLHRIEKLHRQVDGQLKELARRNKEFEAVTSKMNEGLILFGLNGRVISCNPAAQKIMGLSDEYFYEVFSRGNCGREMQELVRITLEEGVGERQIGREGKIYLLRASRIKATMGTVGVALLIFDVTEKVFAERNRKEFTANVSHELKTPLQSIMGSAELISQGIVKPQDLQRFSEKISREARRLLEMINNMISLARLDESEGIPWEAVNWEEIVREVERVLSPMADKAGIRLKVETMSLYVYGIHQLVYDITFNIVENAIKYSGDGEEVRVKMQYGLNRVELRVEDDGIGIPKEDQERVFERFYRVDKSHSKKIEGTGLGLSIVKHSVEYLQGNVQLLSAPNEGTTMIICFPDHLDKEMRLKQPKGDGQA